MRHTMCHSFQAYFEIIITVIFGTLKRPFSQLVIYTVSCNYMKNKWLEFNMYFKNILMKMIPMST